MKKILSMLLVLTMVVTTLMGVMVIDVNAAASIDTSTDPDTITLQFGVASLPGNEKNMAGVYGIGNWYGYGYLYTDEDVAKDPASDTITGTKTEGVNFLETSKVVNPLVGDMMKFDWKAGVITDDAYKAYKANTAWFTDAKVSANYARISVLSPVTEGKITSTTTANYGTVEEEKIYHYSFYAYTDPNTTLDNASNPSSRLLMAHTLGGSAHIDPNLYSNQVPSANGVPHKIDVVFSSDAATNYVNLYVDGVQLSAGASKANTNTKAVAFAPRFGDLTLQSGTTLTLKDTDWYITLPATVPGASITPVTQDDVKANLVVVPNFNSVTQATAFRTDDYITGVIASLDADIKAVLETTTAGDKVVDIYESQYNNPVSLFDTTVENATVKLVSRTTGEEVAPASATGTMDDYYFMVNGIYIIPNKVADPLPYYKTSTDPFVVGALDHQATVTRIHYENYEDNVMDEDLPALGGLRSGFLKYTNAPRGTFSFYKGNIKYGTNDGYYAIKTPQIKVADHGDLDKKLTLEFDMYVPEYVAGGNIVRIVLNAHVDPSVTGTNSSTLGEDIDAIYFTTNGLTGSGFSANRVADLEGNAWNTVAITFDSTDTATDGKYDISVYVNGELQLEYETGALFKDNAAGTETAGGRLCSLNICRLYMPLYTSVGVMNDAWYAGDYTIEKTAVAEGTLDSTNVSDVEISVDNNNNLVAYDNTNDTDYSALISAMTAAGYQPVYNQVVDVDLINEKYDEVDGLIENVENEDGTRTVTGKLVKKWMDSSSTDADVVAATDENNFSTYTIKDANITAAVDNGDGTASITIKSGFSNTSSYKGIASTYEDIIAALAAENPPRVGRTLELTGFAVVEDGKLPKIYSLQGMGTDLYTLAYDETTKVATLNYREFGGTDNIPFVLVVGAYDAKGKLLALDVSEAMAIDSVNEADGVKTKTFTADFGTLDLTTVRKYKVFAFNSFAERKPIITNYSMINPAYVAPVE